MSPNPKRFTPRRHQGQAILWFLVMLAACCAIFALVYNVGQVANRKEETVNAADAAAISGAMVQARMLNFMAYTNRAAIANEVTIAQLVSFDSWIQYDERMLYYLSTYASWIPGVGAALQSASAGMQVFAAGVNYATQIGVFGLDKMKYVLKAARVGAAAAGLQAPDDIAQKVAVANSAQLLARPLSLQINGTAWRGFTEEYEGNDRGEVKQVVLDSRDPFSVKRTEGSIISTANKVLRFGLTEFNKTSGTTELDGFDSWAAQDSLDYEALVPSLCGFPPSPCLDNSPIPVPIGYGRVDANNNNSTGDNLCNESVGFIITSPTLNCKLAENNAKNISGYTGLTSIRDLKKNLPKGGCGSEHGGSGPALTYVAAVTRVADPNLTVERMGTQNVVVSGPLGSPHLKDDLAGGGKLTDTASISTACVFFRRPPRDSTAHDIARFDTGESASLYNPYWQVRLSTADPGFTDKVYKLRGKDGLQQFTQ